MGRKSSGLAAVKVLLAVSGGIAAYKAVELAGALAAAGAMINTIMTRNACRLVGPKSFEAVSCSQVFTDLWGQDQQYRIGHISLAQWADVVVVAPATANIIAKIANGICDELVSTTICACWKKKVLIAPAMNDNMWENPAVQRNVGTIKQMGFELIGPYKGRLACGTEGIGRMAEPDEIFRRIEKAAAETRLRKKEK